MQSIDHINIAIEITYRMIIEQSNIIDHIIDKL